MSQTDSPVRAMFDVQRTAIKQGQQAIKQGLAVQRSADRVAQNGLKGQESLQRQGLELAQAATHSYLSALAPMTAEDSRDQRRNVNEAFSQLKETHAQLFDAMERELDRSVESFDELADEYVDALEEGTDELLDTNRTVEDQTAQNVIEFSQSLREQFERIQEMQDEFEGQLDRQSEHAESLLQRQSEQADELLEQLEADAEEMRQQFERQAAATEGTGQVVEVTGRANAASKSRFDHVDGLDSTHATRLEASGITTSNELASSDPETVADAADVSEEQAEEWIEQADI